jgi:octaprenyl-diphosphate synthase
MHLEEAVRATDALMFETVASDVPVLAEASRHIIAAGGKRVRPRLLFLSYMAVGGTDLAPAVPIAAAIELVHTATLVHDDINDHAHVRRGRVTINERWGRTFALLTGDFLFTQVYTLMAPYGDLNATFAEATVALVEGETLQAWAATEDSLDRAMYQRIVAKKTASLFRAAAMLGAQLHAAEQRYVDILGEFGFYLGLAFQIVDDLLDLTGDPRLMGKGVGLDVGQGKGVAAAYASGENGRDNVLLSDVATLEARPPVPGDGDPFLAIKRRLIAGGAVGEGRQMARTLSAQARAKLDLLPPSPAVDQLRELVWLVVNRDH